MLQETTGYWIIQPRTKKRQSSSSCVFIPEGARGLFPFNSYVFCAGVSRWTGCDSSFNQAANTDWTVTRARSAGTIYTLPVRLEPLTWDSNGSLDLYNQTERQSEGETAGCFIYRQKFSLKLNMFRFGHFIDIVWSVNHHRRVNRESSPCFQTYSHYNSHFVILKTFIFIIFTCDTVFRQKQWRSTVVTQKMLLILNGIMKSQEGALLPRGA